MKHTCMVLPLLGISCFVIVQGRIAAADQTVSGGSSRAGSSLHAAERTQAARVLGRSEDPSAVLTLVKMLGDSEASVRREATKSLGFLKDRRAIDPLLKTLHDPDMNVRMYASYALGELRDARASGPLFVLLQDPKWCVRDGAASALEAIQDATIVPRLVTALQTKEADAAILVRLLQHLGDAETGQRVAKLLDDGDPQIRLRALQVLQAITAPGLLDALLRSLEDPSVDVRRRAVAAIGKQWEDRVRQPLEALVQRETDGRVREAAEAILFEHSPARNLVAYWNFDDTDLQTAIDRTEHGNNGQIRGCTSVDGKIGKGLQFHDGSFIEFGKPAGLPIANQPLTFLAWIQSDADKGVILARGGAFLGYSLYILDGVAKFGIRRMEAEPAHIVQSQAPVVGRWVHLAAVVREDCLELYLDGQLAATTQTPGFIPGNCGQGMEMGFDVANSPAEITDPFEGIIDEVKIYQVALGPQEIAEEFRAATANQSGNVPIQTRNGER